MFLAIELSTSRVIFLPHRQGFFMPSKSIIRTRKIALREEQTPFIRAKAPLHRQLDLSHGQRVLVVICGG